MKYYFSKYLQLHNVVIENAELLYHNDKWTQIQYLEPFNIKK